MHREIQFKALRAFARDQATASHGPVVPIHNTIDRNG